MFFRTTLTVILTAAAPLLAGDAVHLFQQPHMGCLFSIKIVAPDFAAAKSAADGAFDLIREADASFSDYRPESELSRLCATAGSGKSAPVSADLWKILTDSQRYWEWSGGVFDITLGPCTKLWRDSRKSQQLPEPEVLRSAKNASGFSLLHLNTDGHTARLEKPGMRLDLGGIAKGWVLDAAVRLLHDQNHLTNFLIDAGGQIAAMGHPPGKEAWHVAVEKVPWEPDGHTTVVRLCGLHLATSGDLHQFVEIGGKRYSHIVDPASGLGSTLGMQASVISTSGATADVAATVLCLVAPEKGLKLLKSFPDTEARILIPAAAGGAPREVVSPGWRKFERQTLQNPQSSLNE